MKTVNASLKTHLASEVTSIATLWEITRTDGTVYRFTDHDADITYSGNTYDSAAGYDRTTVDTSAGMAVDNLEVMGILDSSFLDEDDLRAGLFDYAEVKMILVNWKDLTQGELKVRRGKLGEVSYSEVSGIFRGELRGLMQHYSQRPIELYTPGCNADLGDSRCGMPIEPGTVARDTVYALDDYVVPTGNTDDRIYKCTTAGTTAASEPTYDPTVGNTTTDGTAVFTAEQSWTRSATVDTVTSNREFTITVTESRAVDDWFKFGAIKWISGNNNGLIMEVKDWTQSTNTVELFLAMPFAVQSGDTLDIYAGCDKEFSTCRDRFDNVANFRGFPYIPGQDTLFSAPDAT